MADAKPLITKVVQSATIGANGQVQNAYTVTFTVGSDGPFTLSVPANQFTAAHVQQQIQAFVAELAQLPRAEG